MNTHFSESNQGSTQSTDIPDVFRYEDYREFMRARFIGMQARDPAFSQRGLARKAGIANPGFFNEVIQGRRRLSPAAALKMARGLDLSEEETEFFSALVEYAETREPGAKNAAGNRMNGIRNRKFLNGLGAISAIRLDGMAEK